MTFTVGELRDVGWQGGQGAVRKRLGSSHLRAASVLQTKLAARALYWAFRQTRCGSLNDGNAARSGMPCGLLVDCNRPLSVFATPGVLGEPGGVGSCASPVGLGGETSRTEY